MKNTLETRLGIFVALAVIAAVLILETVGGVDRLRRGYRFLGLFKNVQELKVGDRVKMAGVEIGRIVDISLTNDQVMVTMKVQAGYRKGVKTDSVATVKYTSLFGQNYVGIDFGSPAAPAASEGTFLHTEEEPDVSAIVQKINNVATGVENLTKSFTGEKIDNLLGPFTDFMRANKDPLTTMIANFQTLSSHIAQGKGTIGRVIYEDTLYNAAYGAVTNFEDAASQMKLSLGEARLTLDDARGILNQAKSGQGTFGKLLTDDSLYKETTASLSSLREILQKINHGQGSVSKLLNEQEMYRNAMLSLQKLDKATEGLEDQGPLSVLGIIVGHLF